MRRRTFVALGLAGALALTVGTGCQSKAEIDTTVDATLATLRKQDFKKFQAMLTDDKALNEDEFRLLSETVRELGAVTDRTMGSIATKNSNGTSTIEAKYTLAFAKGSAELEIETIEGKLVRFNLSGSAVDDAKERAAAKLGVTSEGDKKADDEKPKEKPKESDGD